MTLFPKKFSAKEGEKNNKLDGQRVKKITNDTIRCVSFPPIADYKNFNFRSHYWNR